MSCDLQHYVISSLAGWSRHFLSTRVTNELQQLTFHTLFTRIPLFSSYLDYMGVFVRKLSEEWRISVDSACDDYCKLFRQQKGQQYCYTVKANNVNG